MSKEQPPKLVKNVKVWLGAVGTVVASMVMFSGQIQTAWDNLQTGKLEKVNLLCAGRIAGETAVEQYSFQGVDATASLFKDGTLYVKYHGDEGRQIQCFPAEGMEKLLATAFIQIVGVAHAQLPQPAQVSKIRCLPEVFVEWVEKPKVAKYVRECPDCTEIYLVQLSDGKILEYEEGPCIKKE